MVGRTNAGSGGGNVYAFIKVTYPSGGICTATNGVTTLKARDTSGSWLFKIPNRGTFPQTWDVIIWDPTHTFSVGQKVTITFEGQGVSISPRVPIEYQEVEYIQSTGNQIIFAGDANINPLGLDKNTVIVLDALLPSYQSNKRIFWQDDIGHTLTFYFGTSNGYFKASGFGKTTGDVGGIVNWTNLRTQYIFNLPNSTFEQQNASGQTSNAFTGTYYNDVYNELRIFGVDAFDITYGSAYRFHGLYIIKNDVVQHQFIPVYRLSDSAVGIFDIYGRQFYGDEIGTTPFIVGGDV